MKGLDNELYVLLLLISNAVALLLLFFAIKWPRTARLSFFILFTWASWTNWKESQQTPHFYLEYAELTWSTWYHDFINGWFARHTQLAVGFIATCQALIAISMLMKGWLFRVGAMGAIIFLLAIVPFGVGSGFPCTMVMALAILLLLKKHDDRSIWEKKHNEISFR
jgi:hypothetical protein